MNQQEFYLNQPSNHECFKLPEKDKKYLLKDNLLNEYFNEEDKAQVRSNLGITPLLDELKSIILAKLFDEEGNVTFDLEPHEDAYSKVLSSAVIYGILLKYYTKQELDEWRENFIDEIYSKIQELRDNIHVDDDLDQNSEYPVQNKVLYNIIDQIFDAYSRLSKIKADKEELLNYYTADDIDRIIENFYTKEQSDNVSSSINERLAQAAEYLSQSIQQVANDLQQSVVNERNRLTQAVDNLNNRITQQGSQLESSISDVDNKVDQQVSNLNQSITDLSNKVDSDLSQAVNDINGEIDQQVSNLNQSINNVDNELDQQIQQVNQSIDELDDKVDQQISNINQSIDSLDDKIDQQISNVNQSISSVDNKIDQSINNLDDKIDQQVSNLNQSISDTNSQISQLGQQISDVANNATVNGDNKTIKKESGVLSTLLRIHQLTDQEIDDESIESAYELQNSSGEKIGDRIVINKPSDNSRIEEVVSEIVNEYISSNEVIQTIINNISQFMETNEATDEEIRAIFDNHSSPDGEGILDENIATDEDIMNLFDN